LELFCVQLKTTKILFFLLTVLSPGDLQNFGDPSSCGDCDNLKPPLIELKGKEIPLQALTGPEGFRSLRLPNFKTVGT
jgi:hypothetical protein